MEATDNDLSLILDTPAPEAPEEAPEAEPTEEQDVESEVTAEEEVTEDEEDVQPDEADDEADDDEQPQSFTVKVDGEDVEVTLDDLKRSFAGQGYIQKRMAENAAKAREVEEVYNAFSQERQMLAHLMQQVQSGQLVTPPTPPDPAMRERDPLRYMRAQDAYQQQRQAYDQQQQQITAYTQQQSEAQQRAMAAYQAEQMRELTARLPELSDPERGPAFARQLTEAAQTYGFAPDEVGQVTDHRAILILADAAKWRNLQQQREKATAKTEQARPIVKPRATKGAEHSVKRQAEAAKNRMRSTGNVDDVAAWLITPKKP
ncbi:MAG: hypothetical protein ACK4NW_01955 [Roseinatronobacter sp.]